MKFHLSGGALHDLLSFVIVDKEIADSNGKREWRIACWLRRMDKEFWLLRRWQTSPCLEGHNQRIFDLFSPIVHLFCQIPHSTDDSCSPTLLLCTLFSLGCVDPWRLGWMGDECCHRIAASEIEATAPMVLLPAPSPWWLLLRPWKLARPQFVGVTWQVQTL